MGFALTLQIAHMIGAPGAVTIPVFVGSYIGAMRRFSLPKYIKACAKIRATTLKMVPSVAVAFVKSLLVQEIDLSIIDYILPGGAMLKPEIV